MPRAQKKERGVFTTKEGCFLVMCRVEGVVAAFARLLVSYRTLACLQAILARVFGLRQPSGAQSCV